MTTREELVSILQADFDTPRACELADELIREIADRPAGIYTYESPNCKIRVRRY